jgi:hypothetical protein
MSTLEINVGLCTIEKCIQVLAWLREHNIKHEFKGLCIWVDTTNKEDELAFRLRFPIV